MRMKNIRVRSDNYENNFNTAVSRLLNDRGLVDIHPKCSPAELSTLVNKCLKNGLSDDEIMKRAQKTIKEINSDKSIDR